MTIEGAPGETVSKRDVLQAAARELRRYRHERRSDRRGGVVRATVLLLLFSLLGGLLALALLHASGRRTEVRTSTPAQIEGGRHE